MREVTLQIEEPANRHLKHSIIGHHYTGQMDAAAALCALVIKAIETGTPKILIREEKRPDGEQE